MRIIISPAKTLDFESNPIISESTQPEFLEQSSELIGQLKEMSPEDISNLMNISTKLGELNYQRYQEWSLPLNSDSSRQCLFAFKGDVYAGLESETFTRQDISFAQDHLRILSGLYGLLKPLDLILPYRLEMGTRLANSKGKDLYAFWNHRLTEAMNNDLENENQPCLINLASNEYSKSLLLKNIKAEIITPVFKDLKNGQYKIISFYAKKARGMMSRFLITNRITHPEEVKCFDLGGYAYNQALSSEKNWVFSRDEA